MDLPLIAKQRLHERHGKVVAEATTLPAEILERSVAACFEDQVARHGDRVAVHSVAGALSYDALNAAANQLARWIVQLPESDAAPAAIVLGSRLETIVAILGILKAGRSYVLLEPDWPLARLADLLQVAHAKLILAGQADASRLTPAIPDGARLLRLEERPPGLPESNLDLRIAPDRPASLKLTSGSTGAPKCIFETHRQKLYFVWQSVNNYLYGPAERHAFSYRLSSNAVSKAVLNPLLSGGSLYLSDWPDLAAGALARWIDEHAITTLCLPTVALRELLNVLEGAESLPSVRIVHVGGQTIYRRDAQLFQERLNGGSILVCRYAMTEVGPLAHFLIDRSSQIDTPTIPAGYPLPGRELVILDGDGRDLGYDQVGEIAVRRLLPAEWDPQNDELAQALSGLATYGGPPDLFRTSDLGLLRPDGCLIYLGRKDDMVKVRGHRVALAEAENLLLQVPGVAQAAVKGVPMPGGDNRLVGYVTPGPGVQLTATGIREALAKLAPGYMIPARFVVLLALPLTATGKIDRQALPPPGTARPDLDTPFVAPRNELEQQLADIWAELLELDEVGVDDSFFELGGDSLLGIRLLARIDQELGLKLPVAMLFQPATVERLAQAIRGDGTSPDWTPLVPIQTAGSKPPIFCVPHPGDWSVLVYLRLAQHLGPDQPVYGLLQKGSDGKEPPLFYVEDIADYYVQRVRAKCPQGPYLIVGYSFGGLIAYEMARVLHNQGREVGLVAVLDTDAYMAPRNSKALPRSLVVRRSVAHMRLRFSNHTRNLAALPWRSRPGYIIERIRRMAKELRHDPVPHSNPNLQEALWFALNRYVPATYPGKVTVLRASTRTKQSPEDASLGWAALATGGVKVLDVPGDHWSMIEEPHMQTLARTLAACIDKVGSKNGGPTTGPYPQ